MSKSRVIAIVSLMSLSLLGLVILQLHWVRSALALKEQEFDKNVFDAMYEVVLEHKKSVTADLMKSIIKTHDTVGERLIIINNDTFALPGADMRVPDFNRLAHGIGGYIDERDLATIRRHLPWEAEVAEQGANPMQPMDPAIEAYKNPEWYANVLRDIAGELPMMMLPIDRRVKLDELDVLLDRKLQKRGIDLDYEFAVNRIGSPEVMTLTSGTSESELVQSDYRANLFPDQFLSQPTFLYVHFPKRVGYLLQSMWIRLGTSVVLLLLIIGSFAFVIWTILRQKKLSDMKSDFINNMTHEFKTPIATLSLAGQAIGDADVVKNPDRLNRFGHMILEESGKLGTHVERILQMAQIDKGELKLHKEAVDLHDVIHQLVSNYALRLQENRDTIVTHFQATHSTVHGDPVHLSNMIDNLLDNAVKYSKHDYVKVSVRTRNDRGNLVIAVEDEGIGMKKDTLKRIFDQFYRAGSGNVHNVKGFGLGLSYVKYVAAAHHGEVNVKSEPGHGSTFEVTLPIQ